MKNTQLFQKRQRMLTNDLEVFHYFDTSTVDVNPHQHSFYEIYLFLHGSVSYMASGRLYSLTPGDILLIPPFTIHNPVFNKRDDNYERIVVWFSEDYLNYLSSERTNMSECFKTLKNDVIVFKGQEMVDEYSSANCLFLHQLNSYYNKNDFDNDLMCRSLLTLILISFYNSIKFGNVKNNNKVQHKEIIDSAIEYIHKNISERLTLDIIAEKLFINKFYLAHLFKECTNMSVYQYILRRRLYLSTKYILDGHSVVKVCQLCGFTNYSNYFRTFKDYFGVTPKEYFNSMIDL